MMKKIRKMMTGISVCFLALCSVFSQAPLSISAADNPGEILPGEGPVYDEAETEAPGESMDPFREKIPGYWHLSGEELICDSDPAGAVSLSDIDKTLIKKVLVKSGPETMPDGKCKEFPELEEVIYEAPVTIADMCFIDTNMYRDCPKLKKLTVGPCAGDGDGMEINQNAFLNCTALTEADLGPDIWHLNRDTFGNCTSLKKLTLPVHIHNVRGDSFRGASNLTEIELSNENPYMRSLQNAVYEMKDPYAQKRGSCYLTPCLMFVPEGQVKAKGGNYTVIKGTKDIQYWAFMGEESLNHVTVAGTVESIQLEAFFGCGSLKTVTLPKSLKRVGQNAFSVSDSVPVNTGITDIYYEGSEAEWKAVRLSHYSLDRGKIDKMSIEGEESLHDHLAEAGLPDTAVIHFNCSLKDTEEDLEDLFYGPTVSVNFAAADSPDLATLKMDLQITYTGRVTFNGKKHVSASGKPSGNAANDVVVSVRFLSAGTDQELEGYQVSAVRFRNNRNAAQPEDPKPPYFTLKLKAKSPKSLTPQQKAALKRVNKVLKSDPGARLCFTIVPADISSFTEENYRGLQIVEKNGEKTAAIRKIALHFKYYKGKKEHSDWLLMKKCKKNDPSRKGDYTCAVTKDNRVLVTGQHNFRGSVLLSPG